MLDQFSWARFAFIAAGYTFIAFTGASLRAGWAFSSRNAVQGSTILRVHLLFLAGLLFLVWAVVALNPHFPAWMTDHWIYAGGWLRESDLDVVFLSTMLGLALAEHRRIYVEAESNGEETE